MRLLALLLTLCTLSGCSRAPDGLPPKPHDRNGLGEIDRILSEMELGNLAFNTPSSMNLHDTAMIIRVLNIDTPIEELKRRIEAAGEK